LSGSPASGRSNNAPGEQAVAIQVPSAYISQQADHLDVTLVRTARNRNSGSLTIDFSAAYGSLPAGSGAMPDVAGQQFTPVNQSVTFPAGVTTETVAVPINPGAPNPGLVPVQLSVTSESRAVRGSDETIYLATSPDAVPPSIVATERVRGGIAVTFSKPMGPKTVTNIHNYAVKFSPTQQFSLTELTGVGLIQTLDNTTASIHLRRASYDSATNTVTLVPNEQLGPNGSYTVSNPSNLLAKRGGPRKAHALTDLEGNPLDEGGSHLGTFSITISKGHPYAAATAVLWGGS
jgi:Bacterial Ig-like domain